MLELPLHFPLQLNPVLRKKISRKALPQGCKRPKGKEKRKKSNEIAVIYSYLLE